jgi:hypothetical protein
MSNGSFAPFAIGGLTTRVAVELDALVVSPRARRVVMPDRGGKNDARDYAAFVSRACRFGSGCT